MTYNRITWAPDVLRAVGLTVVEHDGWQTRGLSTSRPFTPRTLVWHHDASPKGDSPGVPAYMIRNYATHGAQLWIDRQGRWHIIASGRAAHTGATLPGMPTNETSIGIETDHTTNEEWPPALLASLRKGSAALLNHMNVTASAGLHFHKSICDPPGRKVDPDGLTLSKERSVVNGLCADLAGTPKPTATAPVLVPTIADCISALKRLAAKSENPNAAKYYTTAIKALGAMLANDNRAKTPTSVAEVSAAIAKHRKTATSIKAKTFLLIAQTALRPIK